MAAGRRRGPATSRCWPPSPGPPAEPVPGRQAERRKWPPPISRAASATSSARRSPTPRPGGRCSRASPASKAPDTPHGFKDATTDPAVIRAWWSASPRPQRGDRHRRARARRPRRRRQAGRRRVRRVQPAQARRAAHRGAGPRPHPLRWPARLLRRHRPAVRPPASGTSSTSRQRAATWSPRRRSWTPTTRPGRGVRAARPPARRSRRSTGRPSGGCWTRRAPLPAAAGSGTPGPARPGGVRRRARRRQPEQRPVLGRLPHGRGGQRGRTSTSWSQRRRSPKPRPGEP